MLQTRHLAHLSPPYAIHVALFKDLQNAAYLKGQLLAGNPDFEYAFIDASMVGTMSCYCEVSKLTNIDPIHQTCISCSFPGDQRSFE